MQLENESYQSERIRTRNLLIDEAMKWLRGNRTKTPEFKIEAGLTGSIWPTNEDAKELEKHVTENCPEEFRFDAMIQAVLTHTAYLYTEGKENYLTYMLATAASNE